MYIQYLPTNSDSYATPQKLYNELDDEFNFDEYDPCPLNDNPEVNGLQQPWAKCTFVNPPYSRLKTTKKYGIGWIEKAHNEAQLGKIIVILIPSRTSTSWFHDIILKNNYEVRFIRGRISFIAGKQAPFESMIVVMKKNEK